MKIAASLQYQCDADDGGSKEGQIIINQIPIIIIMVSPSTINNDHHNVITSAMVAARKGRLGRSATDVFPPEH